MNTEIFTSNTNPWISQQEYEQILRNHYINEDYIKTEAAKLFLRSKDVSEKSC